jgi:hypothetical protein
VADDLEVLGNELELFSDILADLLERATAIRARTRRCVDLRPRGNIGGSGRRTGGVRGDDDGAVSAAAGFVAKLVSSSSTINSSCTTRASCCSELRPNWIRRSRAICSLSFSISNRAANTSLRCTSNSARRFSISASRSTSRRFSVATSSGN